MSHAVGKTPGSSFGVKMVYYDNAAEGVVCILPHDGVDSESDCDRFIAWVLRATIGDSIGCERARKELEKKWGVAPLFQLHLRGYVVRGDDRNPRHDGSTHEFDSFHAVVNERLYMPDGRRRALDDMLVPTSVRQFHPFADVRRGVAGEYLGTTLAL